MGLLANNFRDNFGCYRFVGATLSNNANPSSLKEATHRTGATRNFTAGTGITTQKAGYPNGYRNGGAWSMPQKAGALSTFNNLNGTGTISASILSVKLLEAAINGDGSLTAFGSLLVQALANITGSGGITDADMRAFLAMVAAIGGSGDAEGAATGLAELLAALTGSGTLEDSVITGIAELVADLVVTGTGLTTANIASSVWGASSASNNNAGTMGEKLNDAGSASNPWTEVIESGYTAEEILRLISAVLLGKVSGAGTGTETFRDINDTVDRVIVEATTEGNRTSVTLDGN